MYYLTGYDSSNMLPEQISLYKQKAELNVTQNTNLTFMWPCVVSVFL